MNITGQSESEKKAAYLAYLESAVWKGKRCEALARAKNRCQVCNASDGLDVHHRTYERFGGEELPDDLTVLCRPCHDLFHANRFVKNGDKPQNKKKPKQSKRKPNRKKNLALELCTKCRKIETTKGLCKRCRNPKRKKPSIAKKPKVGRQNSLSVKREPAGKLTKKQRQALALQVQERLKELQDRKTKQPLAAKSGSALERPDVQAT